MPFSVLAHTLLVTDHCFHFCAPCVYVFITPTVQFTCTPVSAARRLILIALTVVFWICSALCSHGAQCSVPFTPLACTVNKNYWYDILHSTCVNSNHHPTTQHRPPTTDTTHTTTEVVAYSLKGFIQYPFGERFEKRQCNR